MQETSETSKSESAVNPIHPSFLARLDPAFVKLYNTHIAHVKPSTDLYELRQIYSDKTSDLYHYATAPPTPVAGIGEIDVPGWKKHKGDIQLTVYTPPGEEVGKRQIWPVHFNFHGGGWAVGDVKADVEICHHICAKVQCCVIDVDYRLVPEYPFPTGIMDALAAVADVVKNKSIFMIDPNNITVGGIESGGTIALILNHLLRDAGAAGGLKGVIVGSPTITDLKGYATPHESPYPSMQEADETPLLNWERLKWFEVMKWMSLSMVPKDKQKEAHKDTSWFMDAMQAPSFDDLAPLTWIGTAECDPLRDEAEAYAAKLKEHGNNVIIKRYPGMPHSFMRMDKVLVQGAEYVSDVIAQIEHCLYPDRVAERNEMMQTT